MSHYHDRKSSGMTLLRHLSIRAGRNRKKNPNGIIGITIGDADVIIEDFKQMKFERDEALRLLGIRGIPVLKTNVIKTKPVEQPKNVDLRWKKVIDELS